MTLLSECYHTGFNSKISEFILH